MQLYYRSRPTNEDSRKVAGEIVSYISLERHVCINCGVWQFCV